MEKLEILANESKSWISLSPFIGDKISPNSILNRNKTLEIYSILLSFIDRQTSRL